MVIDLPFELCEILPEISPRVVRCGMCLRRFLVNWPYISLTHAGYIENNCFYCGAISRHQFLTPLGDDERLSRGLPRLSAKQKLALRISKSRIPFYPDFIGYY